MFNVSCSISCNLLQPLALSSSLGAAGSIKAH